MRAWTLPLSLCLSACVSFQPPVERRRVEFPLAACTPADMASAADALKSPKPLVFDAAWVCVTPPPPYTDPQVQTESSVALPVAQDQALRDAIEAPLVNLHGHARPMLGIALAGGGSKAGAFGTGVLAGMSDVGLLDSADYVSSVSGGSYAAYFYYTHRIFPLVRGQGRAVPTTEELYRDCVRFIGPTETDNPQLTERIRQFGSCAGDGLSPMQAVAAPLDNRYQAFLRCQQDVFLPGRCTVAPASSNPLKTIDPLTLLGSFTLFPLSNVANTLFDWGISLSPSAHTYSDGIGVGYGTTIADAEMLKSDFQSVERIDCDPQAKERSAFDCHRDAWGRIKPVPMSFDELRNGLLSIKSDAHGQVPFWIINATAQRYRSAFGWLSLGNAETGNDDLFEMTAVSHGADKWGYVSAPPSLHDMSVLDAVAASAAFADSSELAIQNKVVKGLIGFGLRLGNFDWGADIPNYNVTDSRRRLHQALPFPLYWTDSGIDRAIGPAHRRREMVDRQHTAFIRLIDGGNGEDLGVYPLLKRNVQTIVVADSASDGKGLFGDICSLERRLRPENDLHLKFLLIPGLSDFSGHCSRLEAGQDQGYSIHNWSFGVAMLMACIRTRKHSDDAEACTGLDANETRVLIVKPAINLPAFIEGQTKIRVLDSGVDRVVHSCLLPDMPTNPNLTELNCDTASFLLRQWRPDSRGCPKFPQDGTATMTLSSSSELFVAYRELGRQYVRQSKSMLSKLAEDDSTGAREFEEVARQQWRQRLHDGAPAECPAH